MKRHRVAPPYAAPIAYPSDSAVVVLYERPAKSGAMIGACWPIPPGRHAVVVLGYALNLSPLTLTLLIWRLRDASGVTLVGHHWSTCNLVAERLRTSGQINLTVHELVNGQAMKAMKGIPRPPVPADVVIFSSKGEVWPASPAKSCPSATTVELRKVRRLSPEQCQLIGTHLRGAETIRLYGSTCDIRQTLAIWLSIHMPNLVVDVQPPNEPQRSKPAPVRSAR